MLGLAPRREDQTVGSESLWPLGGTDVEHQFSLVRKVSRICALDLAEGYDYGPKVGKVYRSVSGLG